MKLTTLLILTVLACAFLFGTAKGEDESRNTFIIRTLIDAAKMAGRAIKRSNLNKLIETKVKQGITMIAAASGKGKRLGLKSKLQQISKAGVKVTSGKNGKVKVLVKAKVNLTPKERRCAINYSELLTKLHTNFGTPGSGLHVGFGTFLGGKIGLQFAKKISDLQQGKKVKFAKFEFFKQRKYWAAKLEKLFGVNFVGKFRFSRPDAKIYLNKLRDQCRRIENALVQIQTHLKPTPTPAPNQNKKDNWDKDDLKNSKKTQIVDQNRKITCSCKKFKGGQKKVCCAWKQVCQGKQKKCRNVGHNCKTAKIFMDKREYVCNWQKKEHNVHQQRCCLHVRSCCGKKCSYATPKCHWRGKVLLTEYHRGCVFKPVGKHSRQRYCCNSKRVCHGGKCQVKKFGCSFRGMKLSDYVEEKCEWKAVKQNVSRKFCCRFQVSCKDSICQRKKLTCKFTSDIISRKQKNRCEWRRFLGGKRLRCCSWISSCAKQKFYPVQCLHHNGKCEWKGEVVTEEQEQKCKWVRIAENTIQRRCCVWIKDCQGKVCKSGPTRCFNSGSPVSTVRNGQCKWRPLTAGKGKVQECCRIERTCQGGKCETKKLDCKQTRIIYTTPKSLCKWVQKKDGSKQRRCCSWVNRCENNKCAVQSPNCVWVGDSFTFKKKAVCSWRNIVNGKQRQCCTYNLRCIGKQCYSSNYICKDVGLPHTIVRKNSCGWAVIAPGKKQKKCCESVKECFGSKCVTRTPKCQYEGDAISKKFKKGCRFVAVGKTGKRKQCCTLKKVCTGKTCVTKKENCKFFGPIKYIKITTACRDVKLRHNATRKQCCQEHNNCVQGKKCKVGKKVCRWSGPIIRNKLEKKCRWVKLSEDEKKKVCCDIRSLCSGKRCSVTSRKCDDVKKVKITRKNDCKWAARKGGVQKRCCSFTERCVNNKCKPLHKQCEWTGLILTKVWTKGCQMRRYGESGRRNFCCKSHRVCLGKGKAKKCKVQRKDCQFTGPIHTTSYSMKCSWVHYAKGCGSFVKRQKCCGVLKTCIGTNCKTAKGQCRYNGNEIPVHPSKEGNRNEKLGKGPKKPEYKVVRKYKPVRVLCRKGKFKCALEGIQRKANLYEKLKKHIENLPSKVQKRMKLVGVLKNRFFVFLNKLQKTPKTNKKGRSGIRKQIVKLNKTISKVAPFLSLRRGFIRNLTKFKFHGKVTQLNKPTQKISRKEKKTIKKAKVAQKNNNALVGLIRSAFGGDAKQRLETFKKLGLNSKGKAPKGGKVIIKGGKIKPVKPLKKQLVKDEQQKKKKAIKIAKEHVCRSNGDPHFKTFSNFYYNNYKQGDFVLVQGPQFAVHSRQQKWGGVSVNTGIAVLTNPVGGKVEIYRRGQVVVDGEPKNINIGQTIEISKGGSVKRLSESLIQVNGVDGSFVRAQINVEPRKGAWPQRLYIDIGVFLPHVHNLKGMCVNNQGDKLVAAGLFPNIVKKKKLVKKVFSDEEKMKANHSCKAAGAKRLEDCVEDVLRSGRKLEPKTFVKFEKRIKRDIKNFAKKFKKFLRK